MLRRAALALVLLTLPGCLTYGAHLQLEYPRVELGHPSRAWLEPDGTVAVVMSSSVVEQLPRTPKLRGDPFAGWPCVVRYPYDPSAWTLDAVAWRRPMEPEEAQLRRVLFGPPPLEHIRPPPGSIPLKLEPGHRVQLDGGAPRLALEIPPSLGARIVAGVWLPFAALIDVALSPVYGIAIGVIYLLD